MKKILALLVSALISFSAIAADVIQASGTASQISTDTKPLVVAFNSTDLSENLTIKNNSVIFKKNGTYFAMIGAQVGSEGEKGYVYSWMRINGKDVANSGVAQYVRDKSFTTVLVSQTLVKANKGDKLEIMFSSTAKGLGLMAQTQPNMPIVPAAILSVYKIN